MLTGTGLEVRDNVMIGAHWAPCYFIDGDGAAAEIDGNSDGSRSLDAECAAGTSPPVNDSAPQPTG